MMSTCLATKTEVKPCQPESYEYTEYPLEPPVQAPPKKKFGLQGKSVNTQYFIASIVYSKIKT